MRGTKKKLTVAVRAPGTTTTGIFGVGPVIAAIVIGCVADVSRFGSRDHFAADNGTAPIEVSSGNRKIHRLSRRGNRRLNHAIHMAAITQIATATAAAGPTTTASSPGARPTKRRSGPSSGGSATPSSPASKPTPGGPQEPGSRAREGNRGATLSPARPAHTPHTGSSAQPLPSPAPPYDPLPSARAPSRRNESQRTLETPQQRASFCAAKPLGGPLRGSMQIRLICAPALVSWPVFHRGRWGILRPYRACVCRGRREHQERGACFHRAQPGLFGPAQRRAAIARAVQRAV